MDRVGQLRAFRAQDPDNQLIVIDLIDALLAAGQADGAQAIVDELPVEWLVQPNFLFRAGRCAIARADYAAAIEPLTVMRELGFDEPGVLHDLAYAHLGTGDIEAAEATLAPIVTQSVVVPDVGVLHARIMHFQRRYEEAVQILEAVLADHPDRADAWGLLAMVESDRDHKDAADYAAGKALALAPRQPDALTAQGMLALARFDAEASYAAFSGLLETQPNHGRALAGTGEALLLRGDSAGARPLLERASRAMPQHLGTWHALAWSALLEGDIDAADAAFHAALAADRNFGESHGGVAVVQALRGDLEGARQNVRVALRLDAGSRNGRYAQALLWRAEGRPREADAIMDGILSEVGIARSGRPLDLIARLQARITGRDAG